MKTNHGFRPRTQFLLPLLLVAGAAPAHAWAPKTHVVLADMAVDSVVDGKICFDDVDFFNQGTVKGQLGCFVADANLVAAIRKYRPAFRAGVLGPDAYPDILFGQESIHPDPGDGGGNAGNWLEWAVWNNKDVRESMVPLNPTLAMSCSLVAGFCDQYCKTAPDQCHPADPSAQSRSDEQNAFAFGFLSHAAGDVFGHTFINTYANGAFKLVAPSNPKDPGQFSRIHIEAESYVGKRTPDPQGTDIASDVVHAFVYRTMIAGHRAPDGTVPLGDPFGLTGKNWNESLPGLSMHLRAWLEDGIASYYDNVDYLQGKIDEIEQDMNGRDCWLDPVCWVEGGEVGALWTTLEGYKLSAGLWDAYEEAWVMDIDTGLVAWPAVSTRVAHDVLLGQCGADGLGNDAKEALSGYVNQYLLYMIFPDLVADLANLLGELKDQVKDFVCGQVGKDDTGNQSWCAKWIAFYNDVKDHLLDYLLRNAIGYSLDDLKQVACTPEAVMAMDLTLNDAGYQAQHLDGNTAQKSLDAQMGLTDGASKFDVAKFNAAYNTVTLIKLALLDANDPGGRKKLFTNLGLSADPKNPILWGMNSLDGSNEWDQQSRPRLDILKSDCAAYIRLFKPQRGDFSGGGQISWVNGNWTAAGAAGPVPESAGPVCANANSCADDGQACAGKNCGTFVTNCGKTVSCGPCDSPNSCQNGQCLCVDNGQACAGRNCGSVVTNCGKTVSCGPCDSPNLCQNGQCCADNGQACTGKSCGPATNNCGTTVQCGSCAPPLSCKNGQCQCAPNCVGKSCTDDNGCGTPCGCPSGGTCNASDGTCSGVKCAPPRGVWCECSGTCVPSSFLCAKICKY